MTSVAKVDEGTDIDGHQSKDLSVLVQGEIYDRIEESVLWNNGEGLTPTKEKANETKEKSVYVKAKGPAIEVNGEIAPWGDNEFDHETQIDDVENTLDLIRNASKQQPRVVQRVTEGLHNLALFASGGFDFVIILDLQQNALKDLSPIKKMAKTLRVLNVSQNEIVTLPDVNFWSQFRCLSICFLSHNVLKSWADVQGLEGCAKSLIWLTLVKNPLMVYANARNFIAKKLPFLKALDDFVTTDQEIVHHAGSHPSASINALNPRLCISHLHVSVELQTDDTALQYVRNTEAAIAKIYADNSPSVRAQKLVRGYLSRCQNFPRFRNVRRLIIHVQKHIRGFLLRQLIKRQIRELVTATGESKLLLASFAAGNVCLSPLARRSFQKMVPMIRRWRTHCQARRRAQAIKKIRFWCQVVYQRHARRTRQLQNHYQKFWIYYAPDFEDDLLTLAMRVARRDSYLMSLSMEDRFEHLQKRCAQSGISILRPPNRYSSLNCMHLNSIENTLTRGRSSIVQCDKIEGHQQTYVERDAKSTLDASLQPFQRLLTSPALIRGFRSDKAVENQLLVAEKQLLQQDLERIFSIQCQYRQDIASGEVSSDNKSPDRSRPVLKHQSRAALLHLNQVAHEIRQRLVICNRNILNACVKQQQRRQQRRRNVPLFSLTKTKVRVRGHAPTSSEQKRLVMSQPECTYIYRKMKVFIPWTIDMYLHMVMRLNHTVSMCSEGPAKAFAFTDEEAKRANAALLIQSAWRASKCHSRQTILDITSARACVCIQRWWRFRTGLRRRLDVLRACLLVGAGINSRTLFMESSVYHALVDSWPAVQAVVRRHHCHEHHISLQMISGTHVKLSLTPEQLLLYTASREKRSIVHYQPQHCQVSSAPSAHVRSSKIELWSSQRCSSYLPAWMPGTPDPEQETTSSKMEATAASLLVDGVQVEPADIKRELTLNVVNSFNTEMLALNNPFCKLSMCQRSVDLVTRLINIARRLSHDKAASSWLTEPLHSEAEATSFVRLTFTSVDEARKRALLLLCKTFDPIAKTHARIYTLEALFGTALRHHQWALSQFATKEVIDSMLDESVVWMLDEIPSRWWVSTEQKLGKTRHAAVKGHGAPQFVAKNAKPFPGLHTQQIPTKDLETGEPARPFEFEPFGPPRVFPRLPHPELESDRGSPVLLHVMDPTLSQDAERHRSDQIRTPGNRTQPQAPSRSASSSATLGSNRHQKLVDRLGTLSYASIEEKRHIEQRDRAYLVRDLREERERALEALIVDRRMLQCEKATEIANLKLDIDVKLQRTHFKREREQLQTQGVQEQQRHVTRRRQLTRKFETSFVAQSGALMRRAARAAVASSLEADEQMQHQLTATVKIREAEALAHRHDAKSFWFARNRQEKRRMVALRERAFAKAENVEQQRVSDWRQRRNEDKEIKKLLNII